MSAKEPTQNPYLFVVGCPRSGTTLLQRMLDAHPDLAVANDSHFILETLADFAPLDPLSGIDLDPALTRDLVEWVRTYRTFGRLGLDDRAVDRAAAATTTYRAFVSALYGELARAHGKPLAGEKSGRYVSYMRLLHTMFPHAKFVHIIRDGRDVALSAAEWARAGRGPGRISLWREHALATTALWWAEHVRNGRRDGAALGQGWYVELRLEDLIASPERALRGLFHFLGLPFSPAMLAFHQGKTRQKAGISTKKQWLPPTAGLRDWRHTMGEADIALFEALAGDLLSELGYDRACPTISPQIAGVADRCRIWWKEDKARKKAKNAERVARFAARATST